VELDGHRRISIGRKVIFIAIADIQRDDDGFKFIDRISLMEER